MGCELNGHARVNQYALVSYIPEPLGGFLDKLRLQLAPGCKPHAHVTILPPRQLSASVEQVETEIHDLSSRFHAFEVKLGSVQLFETTEVIYLEVDGGARQLRQMHQTLNRGAAYFDEPYDFHPHITLAQNLPHEHVAEILKLARESWSGWKGSISFPVGELFFVQNTEQNTWLDLKHFQLIHEPAELVT
jgi:2'-5' RNA ligase